MKTIRKNYYAEVILFFIALIFSSWLMWHTFSYKDGVMSITSKVWSDFGDHIPLIRSFSLGSNFPPDYPLLTGEPLRYHFLFYFLVGMLEKINIPIDFALNIPSAASFTLLILAIYFLSLNLFKSKVASFLSITFFLFNGSLSFVEFFKNHPLSSETMNQIITNTDFPSFAPYSPGMVSAFWSLNTYVNQRHLALPLALFLLLICWLINLESSHKRPKKYSLIGWGVFCGILPYLHLSIFVMIVVVLGILFLLLPRQRLNIAIIGILGLLVSLPRVIFLKDSTIYIPQIKFGYLIADKLTLPNFLQYWLMNLGLLVILLPLGFFLSSKIAKKILIAFIFLFIIGNTVQFSPEMAANHKFFNVFVIVGNIFAAYAVLKLWKLKLPYKLIVPFLIFFLIFSGIIDFFPIKNDHILTLEDYPKNHDIAWIMANTPPKSVFLNSSYLYHPASIAGRKIFYGWPYFAWSLGYETEKHREIMREGFQANNLYQACSLLKNAKIDYVDTTNPSGIDIKINYDFFSNNFVPVYKSFKNDFTIYDVSKSCPHKK